MKIGIGLPAVCPEALAEWAMAAEASGFSSVGVMDRFCYENPEPLVTLAAVAAVTSRIRLQTQVLLAPLRETVLLAKQTATLDRISGGRLTVGLGVGARRDDYEAAERDFTRRGRRLDEQAQALRRLWFGNAASGSPVGPAPAGNRQPEILFGGHAPAALRRVARWGDGYLCAAPLGWAGKLIDGVDRYWAESDRPGRPRHVAQINVAVGPSSVADAAIEALANYYAFFSGVDQVIAAVATAANLADTVRGYAALGVDELIVNCWSADPAQVERVAAELARIPDLAGIGAGG
jgi:alkanesulfonate monooxygenase SsuD/methylene tetrahydromethanopterin reductase-like flavin-dependent oxidoreductase (luciferase family)